MERTANALSSSYQDRSGDSDNVAWRVTVGAYDAQKGSVRLSTEKFKKIKVLYQGRFILGTWAIQYTPPNRFQHVLELTTYPLSSTLDRNPRLSAR